MFLTYDTRKLLCLSSVAVGLLGLCSCATRNARGPQLPADVTMNREAGRGGLLLLTCRMADGEKLPLVLDTGSPITVLDKSLEPKLGKCIDVGTLRNFGATQEVGLYAAPQLYLGRVPLRMAGTANSAVEILIRLKRRNQLPGLSEKVHGQTTDFHFDHYDSPYLDSVTWYLQKDGNPDIYHYTVTRASRHGSWKLKKAWRTDAHDNVLEEYPIVIQMAD
jgi:hypothetical protein